MSRRSKSRRKSLQTPPLRTLKVGFTLHKLGHIEPKQGTFVVDVGIKIRWGDDAVQTDKDLEKCWRPEWVLLGTSEEPFVRDDTLERKDDEVQHYRRVRAIVEADLNLRQFPFDSQDLTLRLRFPRHRKQGIEAVSIGKVEHEPRRLGDSSSTLEYLLDKSSVVTEVLYEGDKFGEENRKPPAELRLLLCQGPQSRGRDSGR
jgi:hypothetical protein